MISYLHAAIGVFLEGKAWDHVERAADYLEELHAMEIALGRSDVPEVDARALREYIAATQHLLHALIGWVRTRRLVEPVDAGDPGWCMFSGYGVERKSLPFVSFRVALGA